MSDLISRQAAIDTCMRKDVRTGYDGACLIAQLPSAQPDVPERNVGEWDMFDLITSAYYGKTMYFKQDNGIVYSRYSCKYMSVDEAIREFLTLIGEDGNE